MSSALCAAVPVPLLDEQLVRAVRRRMVSEMAAGAGLSLAPEQVQQLSGTEASRGVGCFLGLLLTLSFKIAVRLVRRVFRTILFWLLLKDVAEEASRTFHEGYLIHRGLPGLRPPHPAVSTQHPDPNAVATLRARVEHVCREVDTRPFQRLVKESLGGSTRLLRNAASRVRRALRRNRVATEAEREAAVEVEVPKATVDRLLDAISAESEYLRDLDRRWDGLDTPAR